MDTRTQSTPEWLTPLLRYPLWREAELVDILCGLPPRTAPDPTAPPMPRAQFDEEAERRQAAKRHVQDAIQRGELLIEPSLAEQTLLDKIVPHVDDSGTRDRIKRAVFAAPLYEPRKVRPGVAIAWALVRRDLFPHSPLRDEHRAAAEATGAMPAPTLDTRERTSLLKIIAAIADIAGVEKIDIAEPAKAAEKIEAAIQHRHKKSLDPRTIKEHLKAANALDRD